MTPGGTTSPHVLELVRQLERQDAAGPVDPSLALVSQLLEQRQADLEQELRRQEAEQQQLEEVRERSVHELVERALRQLQAMDAELRPTRARLDVLADALGACSACWGDDPGCRWCRGRGRPGSHLPDETAFRTWVVPAVRAQTRSLRAQTDDRGGRPAVADDRRDT